MLTYLWSKLSVAPCADYNSSRVAGGGIHSQQTGWKSKLNASSCLNLSGNPMLSYSTLWSLWQAFAGEESIIMSSQINIMITIPSVTSFSLRLVPHWRLQPRAWKCDTCSTSSIRCLSISMWLLWGCTIIFLRSFMCPCPPLLWPPKCYRLLCSIFQ